MASSTSSITCSCPSDHKSNASRINRSARFLKKNGRGKTRQVDNKGSRTSGLATSSAARAPRRARIPADQASADCRQPQDGKGAPPQRAGSTARPRRRGDRMKALFAAPNESPCDTTRKRRSALNTSGAWAGADCSAPLAASFVALLVRSQNLIHYGTWPLGR
jgi:hypothetical protein